MWESCGHSWTGFVWSWYSVYRYNNGDSVRATPSSAEREMWAKLLLTLLIQALLSQLQSGWAAHIGLGLSWHVG